MFLWRQPGRWERLSESVRWMSSTKKRGLGSVDGRDQNERSQSAPRAPAPLRRVTIGDLQKMKKKDLPITMLTAYDYPSAVHADLAHVDVVLVGDSLGMVVLGHDTTQTVTMEEMLHHCRAVMRGARRPLVIADMPFGSYEINAEETMRNAFRLVKEGGVNAVKLEGGTKLKEHVSRVVKSGIAVCGHTGLTPASVSAIGQFRSFGKTAKEAIAITEDALALQDAGAFAVVLECIPENVARFVTDKLEIPTIGIGAGRYTSGQVLVYHDVLGMLSHPHHAKVTPKFVKRFARCAENINTSLKAYKDEVQSRAFPSSKYSPYKIPESEWELLVSHFANTAHVMPPQNAVKPVKRIGKKNATQWTSITSSMPTKPTSTPPPSSRNNLKSIEDEDEDDSDPMTVY